uniref:PCI domain-containing protein n=1 Tax=Schistocephalus solidus TaxID=70667 RepID=A0A183T8X4_SCHSO
LQIIELKNFLKEYGVDKVDQGEVTQENWVSAFIKCIPLLSVCWTNDKVTEAQAIDLLTTVASLIIQLPVDSIPQAVEKLCVLFEEFKSPVNRRHLAKLYSLNVLFAGLTEEDHARFRIYQALITCAHKVGALHQIFTNTERVANLLKACRCTPEECKKLWRQLSEVHMATGNTKQATQALINLLSTYTAGNAVDARNDAVRCIVAAIQDLSFLSHSRLMALEPVQFLEGEPIHKLLGIFVSGGLSDFSAFTKKYPKFLSENGLTEEACLSKIRILCLMEMAENIAELDYETVCKKIELPEDQLEAFVIEAVRQKVITCKLDQINRRILITSALPRNFGRSQWLSLAKTLQEWRVGLRVVQSSLGTMIGAAAAAP